MPILTGSCHCGAVKVEVPRRPRSMTECNCSTCGCVTHWTRIRPRKVAYMGVNMRNFEPSLVESVRVRRLDGAKTWKYLD